MALLSEATIEKNFDIRVVEKNVRRGLVRSEDFQKSVADLPDDAENADWVSLEMLHGPASTKKTSKQ